MTQTGPTPAQPSWRKRLASWLFGEPDRPPRIDDAPAPNPPAVTPPASASLSGDRAAAPPEPANPAEDRQPEPSSIAASDPEQARADSAEPMVIALAEPVGCVLWTQPELISENSKAILELLRDYENSNHFSRSLFKCRECGQLYFYEFYEWVDWDNDNDKIYTTYVPVANEAEIEQLKATDVFSLMRYFPRLQWDAGTPVWRKL